MHLRLLLAAAAVISVIRRRSAAIKVFHIRARHSAEFPINELPSHIRQFVMAYEQPSFFLCLLNLTIRCVLSLLAAALDAGGVTAELAMSHVVP